MSPECTAANGAAQRTFATRCTESTMSAEKRQPGNEEIAEMLERIADLLEAQHASIFRVRAYRAGARTVRNLELQLSNSVKPGEPDSLEDLPGIGHSLAAVIREFVAGEQPKILERLEGQVSPAAVFATIPSIGEELAERIEKHLHVDTLEDLEAAAHDGRLETVPGFGPRRVLGVKETLGYLLRNSPHRTVARDHKVVDQRPPVSAILEVDKRYRARASRGTLRKISPRRFNPEHRVWLPVFHCELDGWSMTAMFSNTARAHYLDRTGDWVVVYYERDGVEGQCTVVTEHAGRMKDKRVVRGREAECAKQVDATKRNHSAPSRA